MKSSLTVTTLLLIVSLGCTGSVSVTPGAPPESEDESLHSQLLGAWAFAGRPGEEYEPEPGGQVKFWGERHWAVTQWDPETGIVLFHLGGTYTLDGDQYVEQVTYADESIAEQIGEEFRFTIQVEGDTYTQVGQGNDYNEVWRRLRGSGDELE